MLLLKNIGIALSGLIVEVNVLLRRSFLLRRLALTDQASLNNARILLRSKPLSTRRKGVRTLRQSYRIGSMLNIKPVLTCVENGEYTIAKKTRGWRKSCRTDCSGISLAQQFDRVHGNLLPAPNIIYSEMEAMIKEATLMSLTLGMSRLASDPVVHTGPGLLAMPYLATKAPPLRTAAYQAWLFS